MKFNKIQIKILVSSILVLAFNTSFSFANTYKWKGYNKPFEQEIRFSNIVKIEVDLPNHVIEKYSKIPLYLSYKHGVYGYLSLRFNDQSSFSRYIIRKNPPTGDMTLIKKRIDIDSKYLNSGFNTIIIEVHYNAHTTGFMVLNEMHFDIPQQSKGNANISKQIKISIEGKSIVPPPRQIDDITEILYQKEIVQEEIAQLNKIINEEPPQRDSIHALVKFYINRSRAARKQGRLEQSHSDLRLASALIIENKPKLDGTMRYALSQRGVLEYRLNNLRSAIEFFNQISEIYPDFQGSYVLLVYFYAMIGDIEGAEKARDDLILLTKKKRHPWKQIMQSRSNAVILDAKGDHQEAERDYRTVYNLSRKVKSTDIQSYLGSCMDMAINLLYQGRMVEAELFAREAVIESVKCCGSSSMNTRISSEILARILSKQSRYHDAEKLLTIILHKMIEAKIPDDSLVMGAQRYTIGEVLAKQGKWEKALIQFDLADKGLERNPSAVKDHLLAGSNIQAITLLQTGNTKSALGLLKKSYAIVSNNFGSDHLRSLQLSALTAVCYADFGKSEEAYRIFNSVVPELIKVETPDSQQMKIIMERYLKLLIEMKNSALEQELGIDSTAEAFGIADAARSRSVNYAILQSLTRATLSDPETSQIVRQEQDFQKKIETLERLLSKHLSAPEDQQYPDMIKDLSKQLIKAREARSDLLSQIEQKSPDYVEKIKFFLTDYDAVRQYLNQKEALISIYPTCEKTYIWVVPKVGEAQFAISSITEREIHEKVSDLRKSLDAKPERLGDIPLFDTKLAYEMYLDLVKPVENLFLQNKDIIVIATGPLGQLPFSVLPTEHVLIDEESDELFSNYKKIPWLIRKVSLTRLPSVASFVSVRTTPESHVRRKAFIGFGDPIFNATQLAEVKRGHAKLKKEIKKYNDLINVRGIRITDHGGLDSNAISSVGIEQMNRLPETAEEIKSIAEATGGKVDQDVFLGKDASEHNVKTLDLSERKVVAFASHALIPGDLDGLTQPAIALSSPTVIGGNDDGLLTLEEVLRLNLNADWVILSACNTGASDGVGAEAVSGLGRAFFYAGTRAMLVSMWPVESKSAIELTTGIFKSQKENSSLSRSKSLQRSMLELIDNGVIRDDSSGKIMARYAHPMFWAPFIIIGDGR